MITTCVSFDGRRQGDIDALVLTKSCPVKLCPLITDDSLI